ncbi:F-box/LRR-repeat protein 2-like [Aphidius gifuensis]|uniref:F-box/LRR-repeat protein 2-like n=1 Tax=Aphidius gifuensis TaxID=684658 RepID=UPI001CDD51A7|nr:F-box/LRR-repeat protein 2-like [Aphidius gifuensis]
MLKYCKQLKHLTIKCATADAIEKLTNLESLECLKFHTGNKISKETIIAISNNCKKLKHLEIPNFQLVLQSVDDDPHTVSRVLDDLSNLEHLEYLNFADCELLQGSTVIAIADKCKYLKYLNVRGHNNLTKLSYDALTKLENLQELTVGCSLAVTNDFVKKLKGLKVFNCDRCLRLTDDGIIQLIKNCPDLERLSLFHVMSITLNTIIAADLETKNRNNGIVLCIRISDAELYEAAGRIITSQWLMTDYSDDPSSIIVTCP